MTELIMNDKSKRWFYRHFENNPILIPALKKGESGIKTDACFFFFS